MQKRQNSAGKPDKPRSRRTRPAAPGAGMDLYRKIKPKRVSQQVFEQLRELIFKAQLKPGQQLLPERELAETLGVSRPTVREAINKLVDRGLLEHRQGQGTFVRSPEKRQAQNPLLAVIDGHEATLLELLEVRLALECNAAALAARRATAEDIAALEKSYQDMRRQVQEGGMGIGDDMAFHMAIAYASKNNVQIHIMKHLYDLVHAGIKKSLSRFWENPDTIPAILEQHGRIVEAIKERDDLAALNAMRRHIEFVIQAAVAGAPQE